MRFQLEGRCLLSWSLENLIGSISTVYRHDLKVPKYLHLTYYDICMYMYIRYIRYVVIENIEPFTKSACLMCNTAVHNIEVSDCTVSRYVHK